MKKIRQANLGRKHTPEALEKMRQANIGRKPSPEAIEKSRQANIGRKHTEEAKEKLRQSHLGKKHTEESKEKLRQASLGRKHTPGAIEKIRQANMKPVVQYTCEGKFMDRWESATTAGEVLGINRNHISECCSGTQKRKSAGGYIWRFWEDTFGADIEPYVNGRKKSII